MMWWWYNDDNDDHDDHDDHDDDDDNDNDNDNDNDDDNDDDDNNETGNLYFSNRYLKALWSYILQIYDHANNNNEYHLQLVLKDTCGMFYTIIII
jgi:hypothetical protein